MMPRTQQKLGSTATTPVLPFQSHSATSRAAALASGSRADADRVKVFQHLNGCGPAGATDDEMQVALEMNGSTQRPRRIELVASGVVKDSGTKRPTRTGHAATVWVVKPEGGKHRW